MYFLPCANMQCHYVSYVSRTLARREELDLPIEAFSWGTACTGIHFNESSKFSWKHKMCRGCFSLWIYVGTVSTAWNQNDGNAASKPANSYSLVFTSFLGTSVPHRQHREYLQQPTTFLTKEKIEIRSEFTLKNKIAIYAEYEAIWVSHNRE